ncbi:23S rRNA (uracil(1939)-C(5))-methyltransferase RlmD [Lacticaseibacillus thailandensis]|uniref:tRNA (Uracil-5-)-methyltransferase n=1 Tax=Lacticaseibacillus thailandensis DSM 22698 = JCM 13996 TaxID=1423810 RepID=A0A0R2CH20_9LACO|nr:23S rRNA (uracil(1939)-C(5))-methyltransferase RlmD [Lacticaseibacillus thailandensis]KRM87785.1 tRNA (uracil-5-)-methyltransferase [Lacticaseibacillus thailandensis DSM 22698 = JCM 13996]
MEQIPAGTRFPLTIKRLDINGAGIGYYKRKITFVPGALPGEVVVAEVTQDHDRYIDARVHRIRKQSPDRITPVDPLYGRVGGIELGALAYPAQLRFKTDVIHQALERYRPRRYEHYDVRPTIAAPQPLHYRNKAQFQVRVIDGHVRAGLYAPGSHDLVPLSDFATQMPIVSATINQLCQIMEDLGTPIYDEEHNSGIVKTLAVRASVATGEVQVTFITNSHKLPGKNQILARIAQDLPAVVSVNQNFNPGRTTLVWGPETTLLAGEPYITEQLNGMDFLLSPQAFLQLNPAQTTRLYQEALTALNLAPHETLVDAYCGAGTLGLGMAQTAASVRGMDTIPAAIDDARTNADRNGITNVDYEVGKAEDLFPKWLADGFRPDAVIVDPPRTGLEGNFIPALLKARPRKFVYISCNPSTLARDLTKLTRTYEVEYIQSIDMFPQTARCEAITGFKLKQRGTTR